MLKPCKQIPRIFKVLKGCDTVEAMVVLLACIKMMLETQDEQKDLHKLIVAYLKPPRRKGKKVKHLRVIKGGKR